MHRRPHLSPAAACLALPLLLAACSGDPPAAPRAGDPACVRALGAAPAKVLGHARTSVGTRGALAWGDPRIVLRCGLPGLVPTANPCLEVNGVGWVIANPDADPVVFTLYGRDPTVEVSVPASYGRAAGSGALVDLAPVAPALPANGRTCD